MQFNYPRNRLLASIGNTCYFFFFLFFSFLLHNHFTICMFDGPVYVWCCCLRLFAHWYIGTVPHVRHRYHSNAIGSIGSACAMRTPGTHSHDHSFFCCPHRIVCLTYHTDNGVSGLFGLSGVRAHSGYFLFISSIVDSPRMIYTIFYLHIITCSELDT